MTTTTATQRAIATAPPGTRYAVILGHSTAAVLWQFCKTCEMLPTIPPTGKARAKALAASFYELVVGRAPAAVADLSDDKDALAVSELADWSPPLAPAIEEIAVSFSDESGKVLAEFSAPDSITLAHALREAGRKLPKGGTVWASEANIGDGVTFYDKLTQTFCRIRKHAAGSHKGN